MNRRQHHKRVAAQINARLDPALLAEHGWRESVQTARPRPPQEAEQWERIVAETEAWIQHGGRPLRAHQRWLHCGGRCRNARSCLTYGHCAGMEEHFPPGYTEAEVKRRWESRSWLEKKRGIPPPLPPYEIPSSKQEYDAAQAQRTQLQQSLSPSDLDRTELLHSGLSFADRELFGDEGFIDTMVRAVYNPLPDLPVPRQFHERNIRNYGDQLAGQAAKKMREFKGDEARIAAGLRTLSPKEKQAYVQMRIRQFITHVMVWGNSPIVAAIPITLTVVLTASQKQTLKREMELYIDRRIKLAVREKNVRVQDLVEMLTEIKEKGLRRMGLL